jgi:hypothetical protein
VRQDSARFELVVLRARVHVRLDRGDRALEALRAVEFTALTVDQYATARMLTGAAYVRIGQKARGEHILRGEVQPWAVPLTREEGPRICRYRLVGMPVVEPAFGLGARRRRMSQASIRARATSAEAPSRHRRGRTP